MRMEPSKHTGKKSTQILKHNMFQQGLPTPLQSGNNPYPGTPVMVLSAREAGSNSSVTFNKEALELLKVDGLLDRVRFRMGCQC